MMNLEIDRSVPCVLPMEILGLSRRRSGGSDVCGDLLARARTVAVGLSDGCVVVATGLVETAAVPEHEGRDREHEESQWRDQARAHLLNLPPSRGHGGH